MAARTENMVEIEIEIGIGNTKTGVTRLADLRTRKKYLFTSKTKLNGRCCS